MNSTIKKNSSIRLQVIIHSLLMSSCILFNQVSAQTLPSGFTQVQVASGITNPTVMSFSPDGRLFVAGQSGVMRVIKNGVLLTKPFISLSVNASGERGLLGIAFDPNFNSNNYLYLYYTLPTAANNRISRFTASGDTVIPGSESIILNLDPLSGATNHNGGTMKFGNDGMLYVGIGENANSANSQNLDTYHGKVIRINPNGTIPAGNPYPTGTVQRRSVWQYGLRNPYTLSVQSTTGKIFVNDVGQNTWEEINNATTGGLNFGWPTAEGNSVNPAFTNPIYAYSHGSGDDHGCAITGGTFYNPTVNTYPPAYTGAYFYVDFCNNWINYLTISGTTATRFPFATGIAGSPVSITTGNDGNLYFLSRSNNAVYKVVYNGATAPVISSQPQSLSVNAGQSATFSVSASGTLPLAYQWKKNTINIPGATGSTLTISNVNSSHAGQYTVTVTNTVSSVTSNAATLTVSSNALPVAQITSPTAGTTYAGGNIISFSGTASDTEDGTIPASSFDWVITFHHDNHIHPGPAVASGVPGGQFTIPNTGETASNVYYRIHLIVTDSQGAIDSSYIDILPRIVTITLQTAPVGLTVTLDGQPVVAPYTFTGVEGILRTLGVVTPQTISNALIYNWSSWQHGGSVTQNISTPATSITYTANFTAGLRTAETAVSTTAGLNYSYYEGIWSVLPDFNSLSAVTLGTVTTFSLSPMERMDDFGFNYQGYISVPVSGIYTFYLTSDDGSNLYIGNSLVVANDGLHGAQERTGKIGLKAGLHAIRVLFFEHTGNHVLTASYEGPGINKQSIPASVLYKGQTSSVLTPVADAFIRTGSHSSTAHGVTNSKRLNMRNGNTAGENNMETLLKFNISDLSENFSSAKIRLYGNLKETTTSSVIADMYEITDSTWLENTVTWDNKPAVLSTVIASRIFTGNALSYHEWDITSWLITKTDYFVDNLIWNPE